MKGGAGNGDQMSRCRIDAKGADGGIAVVADVEKTGPAFRSGRDFSGIHVASTAVSAGREWRTGNQRKASVPIHLKSRNRVREATIVGVNKIALGECAGTERQHC